MASVPRDSLPLSLAVAVDRLPLGLREHIQRVRVKAGSLAASFALDTKQVDLAAAAHDICRAMKGSDLLGEARRRGLSVNRVEEQEPLLLHGPVAAARLKEELGIGDREVVEAVHWHSTAAPGLHPIAKVVFLADKLDPTKASRYPFFDQVRELANKDLDQALVAFLTGELQRLLQVGQMVHPASLEARNELLLAFRHR